MKKFMSCVALSALVSTSFAENLCSIALSTTETPLNRTVSFNITTVDKYLPSTYSLSFLQANSGGILEVPCNATYRIAATITNKISGLTAASSDNLDAKGPYVYRYNDVFLSEPNGSVTVSFPADFDATGPVGSVFPNENDI